MALDGSVSFDARAGGVRLLEVVLQRGVAGGLRRVSVTPEPASVDLDNVVDGQVIELRLDPGGLSKALAEIAR